MLESIILIFMPSYSSDFQPVERLWFLTNGPLINHSCVLLDELEDLSYQRWCFLQSYPDPIRDLTRFHWWPLIE